MRPSCIPSGFIRRRYGFNKQFNRSHNGAFGVSVVHMTQMSEQMQKATFRGNMPSAQTAVMALAASIVYEIIAYIVDTKCIYCAVASVNSNLRASTLCGFTHQPVSSASICTVRCIELLFIFQCICTGCNCSETFPHIYI